MIYGASSVVGGMAGKVAQVANIHPLICVAGSGANYVSGLINKSKVDVVLYYKDGEEALTRGFRSVLGDRELGYAFSSFSELHSLAKVAKIPVPELLLCYLAEPTPCPMVSGHTCHGWQSLEEAGGPGQGHEARQLWAGDRRT